MNREKLKVLFIGGYGRSGSTLIERVLGQIDGIVAAGEIRYLWTRGFGENCLCGCGRQFAECPFWRAITERAFGGSGDAVEQATALWRSIDRIRHVPRLSLSRLLPSDRAATYAGYLGRLYAAIREVSGCRVIVDSSKWPSHGLVLREVPGIDLFVLHLVRDSRAVVYSWSRPKRDPRASREDDYMPRIGTLRSTVQWLGFNTAMSLLRYVSPRSMLLRYEDLARRPLETVQSILAFLNDESAPANFLDDRSINLDVSHTFSGNPVRFKTGTVRIAPDTRWAVAMRRDKKALVTALTFPFLVSWGYLAKAPPR